MNCWEILKLSPTSDEKEIKKAYRAKLRQHHPEEDPEGFQRVREAYEAAIRYIQQAGTPPPPPETAAKSSSSPPTGDDQHPLIQSLHSLLNDPTRRFLYLHWQHWFQQTLQAPIKEQDQISEAALQQVLSNRWLPGEVIEWFWQGLGWEILLKTPGQQAKQGELLNLWRQQKLLIPLSDLETMTGAEQRAVLSFLHPLQKAWAEKSPAAVNYLFSQATHGINVRSVPLAIIILQASLNCPAITPGITSYFLSWLNKYQQDLSAEQLLLMARVYLRQGQEKEARLICHRLLDISANAEIAEIQYELALKTDQRLAAGFAFLRQQLMPLPAIYWRAERQLFQVSEESDTHPLFSWIYHQLIDRVDNRFNHSLDLRHQSGLYGTILKRFWAGLHGSWAYISEQLNTPGQEINADWQLLYQLTDNWLHSILASQQAPLSLIEKLSTYGQDNFFEQPDLTEDELHSLSPESWREYLCRHPLIPDNWFEQLMDAGYISTEILDENPLYPYYVDTLCFYRCVNRHFQLTSPWEDQPFAGSFDWALTYYGQLVTSFRPENQGLTEYLSPLPETLTHSALYKIIPFIREPDIYQSESIEVLSEHPEQFVFRYITNTQVRLLVDHYSVETLGELAKEREPSAYAALSIQLQQESFEEAIVYWNLLVTSAKEKAQFNAVIDWQQQALLNIRTEKNYEQEFYEYAKPEILYWMLLKETEHFSPPEEVAAVVPDKEAKVFHYPVFYIITQLQHGISPDGYDISPLKPLIRQQDELDDNRRQAASLALGELEHLYQQHLDLDACSQRVKSFSKNRLRYYFLLMVTCWILNSFSLISGMPPGDTTAYGHSPILTGVFLSYECFLTWRVTQYLFMKGSKIYYLMFVLVTLLAAGIFGMKLFIGFNFLTHALFIQCLSPLRVNGFWEKKILRRKKIDLKQLVCS